MPTLDAPPPVLSPNSVLANALLRSIDMIRPQVIAKRPKRIVFVVGTQINGAPHLGTNIVQTSAFLLAKLARRSFGVETAVTYFHSLCIDPVDGGYLDLATLYRNVIKERAFVREPDVLYVMVKGGDWAFGAQLVDGALLALGTPAADMPARIFTPMVLSGSGAKLSKSLLRAAPDSPAHAGIEE